MAMVWHSWIMQRSLQSRGGARLSPLIPVFRGQGHMASTNTMDLKRAVMALN